MGKSIGRENRDQGSGSRDQSKEKDNAETQRALRKRGEEQESGEQSSETPKQASVEKSGSKAPALQKRDLSAFGCGRPKPEGRDDALGGAAWGRSWGYFHQKE